MRAVLIATIAAVSAPAAAQMTPISPAEWSTPNVMVEGMRNGARSRPQSRREIEAGPHAHAATCQGSGRISAHATHAS